MKKVLTVFAIASLLSLPAMAAEMQKPAAAAVPAAVAATPAAPVVSPQAARDAEYLAQVAKIKANPKGPIDWPAIRALYMQTSFYDPYGGAQAIWYALQRAGQALANQPGPEEIKAYQDLLDRHFAHYRSHLQALDLWNKTNSPLIDKELHERAFRDILRTIRITGDGKTPETAFHVMDPAEEGMILKAFHYRLMGQEFRQNNGQFWDVLKYVDPQTSAPGDKPQTQEMFFNVNAILQASGGR